MSTRIVMRRALSRLALLVITLGMVSRMHAASLRVPISIRSSTAIGKSGTAEVRLTPVQVDDRKATDVITLPVEFPGLFGIYDLPEGTWMIEVVAPGFWHQPKVVSIGSEAEVPFVLWRTATIHGSVVPPKGHASPRQLLVRFQSAPAVAEAERIPPTEIRCPVTESRWSCEIPAGLLDLRIRAATFQTSFHWDVELQPEERRAWGEVALRAGTSLVGTVASAPGVKADLSECKVLVDPSLIDRFPGESVRGGIKTSGGKPNRRGVFQLDGLSPGDYTVTALAGTLRSRPVRVRLIADKETELLEPLLLETPSAVTLRLVPPLDPDLKPWQVLLVSRTRSGGYVDPVTQSAAGDDGVWKFKGLHSGPYKALISTASGSRWAAREIEIAGSDADVTVEVPVVRVVGTIKLGDRPISATIFFGGESAEVRIPLRSDEEGQFDGFLPPMKENWSRVTVESTSPPLKRTILDVPVDTDNETQTRIDIRLPATHLSGEVVDEKGQKIDGAIVRIDDDGRDWEVDIEAANGAFEAFGHPPGGVTVHASGYMVESDPVRVELLEDQTTQVRLVLKRSGLLSGRVVSASGPVGGARVVALPTDVPAPLVIGFPTNARGEFGALVPPGTRSADVFVEANGYAAKMFHLRLPEPAEPIEIPLDPNGGSLVAEVPRFDGYGETPAPYLVHNGAQVSLRSFDTAVFDWTLSKEFVTVRIPLLERGMYSLCLASNAERPLLRAGRLPPDRCKSGFLPPLGELKLMVGASARTAALQ